MRRIFRWLAIAGILMVIVLLVLTLTLRPYRVCASLASREYLGPGGMQMMPLPKGCLPVHEGSPVALLEIVEGQKKAYRLELQRIIVCRMSSQLPNREPDFTLAAFDDKTRSQWLPLYVGCCAYQFRRHVTVVAQQNDGQGAIVVMAALIQSRWNYLRFLRWHCDEKLRVWE